MRAATRRWDERGSVTVLAAALIFLAGVLSAVTVDLMRAVLASSRGQAAADAAALAAAQELAAPTGSWSPTEAAAFYAEQDGATLLSCSCEPFASEAVVVVQVSVTFIFLGPDRSVTATARAVVGVTAEAVQPRSPTEAMAASSTEGTKPRLSSGRGRPGLGARPSPQTEQRIGSAPMADVAPSFASAWRRKQLSLEERVARGTAARRHVPRSTHGRWEPPVERPDPITLLEEQARARVPDLVPIRHGRMMASPFAFFRGSALLMAADLAGSPDIGVTVQLCGDAHLSNFGLFGSPERRLLFDINDFDETHPGPWEWDVKRLAASLEVAGRDRGFSSADRRDIVMAAATSYRKRMRQAAGMRTLEAWYEHLEAGRLLDLVKDEVRRERMSKREGLAAQRIVAEARTRDSIRVMAKRTRHVDGERRIVANPPLIVPLDELIVAGSEREAAEGVINKALLSYRRTLARHHHPIEEFRYVHAARKVVGVGSVGTRCYILLLTGRDGKDPLFLQVKEAQASVLERFLGSSEYPNHGERVVVGQRLMQAASDIFLGWIRLKGVDGVARDYYVRQLHDWKGGAEVDRFLVSGAHLYARICGATLARAHARWGDRVAIASYLGRGDVFDRAIARFAQRYADQNERDYEAFLGAIDSGRLEAQPGV